jgi:hypothetical protein
MPIFSGRWAKCFSSTKVLREGGRQACDRRVVWWFEMVIPAPAKPVQRPEFQQTDATASRKKRISGRGWPPSIHQLFHQPLLVLGSKVGIAHPQKSTANYKIASTGRDCMLQARHQMKGLPPVTATVVPEV